jgi:hypothetical protein
MYIQITKLDIINDGINHLELVTLSGEIRLIARPPGGILIASHNFFVERVK